MNDSSVMDLDLIVVPYDSGKRSERLGRGPEVLIREGLPERLQALGHDVAMHTVESASEFPTEASVAFELAGSIAKRVRQSRARGRFPLTLAGNCIAAVGVAAGLGEGHGVVWLDAHGDLNTPDTTRSAFLDGMSVSVLLGSCWSAAAAAVPGFSPVPEASVALIGARDLDPPEQERLSRSAITNIDAAAVRNGHDLPERFRTLRADARAVYLHVDLDVLDPTAVGPANRFAAAGGLSVDDVCKVVGALKQEFEIAAATISAYDPAVDSTHAVRHAAFEIVREIATR